MKFYLFLFLIGSSGFLTAQNEANDAIKRLKDALEYIEQSYVDTLEMDDIVEDAIIGVLSVLDPHSYYNTKEEIEVKNQRLNGSFKGIGIRYISMKDTSFVLKISPNSPAEKSKVLVGDALLKVNKTSLLEGNVSAHLKEAISESKDVKLTILRDGKKKKIKVEPDALDIPSVNAVGYVNDVLYIKVVRFGRHTVSEIKKKLNDLTYSDDTKIVVDLRGNGGGYLSTAIELSNLFLDKGALIVETKAKGKVQKSYQAKKSALFLNNPLYVFVDEHSASASEIFSGAIQDNDRGLIVGRRTFGKGLVQSQHKLNNGDVIRLTTSRYYTPAGRCIQKSYEKGYAEYKNDLKNRMKSGEFFFLDSIETANAHSFSTLKLKRTVYDNGGITPDIFVALDTTSLSNDAFTFFKKQDDYRYYFKEFQNFKSKDVKGFFEMELNFVENDTLNNEIAQYFKIKMADLIFTQAEVDLYQAQFDEYFKKINSEILSEMNVSILNQNIIFESK